VIHIAHILCTGMGHRDRMAFRFTATCASNLNPAHSDVYSIQHYVTEFVSDLRQVGSFLRFPPPIKLTATI